MGEKRINFPIPENTIRWKIPIGGEPIGEKGTGDGIRVGSVKTSGLHSI